MSLERFDKQNSKNAMSGSTIIWYVLLPCYFSFFTPYRFNASIMSQQYQASHWEMRIFLQISSIQILRQRFVYILQSMKFFHLIIPHLIEKENEEDCNYDSPLTTNCTFSPVLLSFYWHCEIMISWCSVLHEG